MSPLIGSQYDRNSATPIVIDNVFLSVASTTTDWYVGLLGYCNLKDANAFTMKNSVIMNNISDGNAEKVGVIGRVGSYAINMTNCYLINTKGYVASVNSGTTEEKDALHLPSTNTAYSYTNADAFAEEYLGGNIREISDFVLNLAVSKMSVTLINSSNIATLLTATSGTFVLTEDIDMSTAYTDNDGVWASTANFTGTLNGNGHTISNLNTTTGLFAQFNGGTIKNLALTNIATTGSIGVIATGYDRNAATAIGYTIYVTQYDVTNIIKQGKNAFGLIVAGGWYRSGADLYGNYRNFGKTGACFKLCIETISGKKMEIDSGTDCRWMESFLLQAGIFHEEQDERKEIADFSLADYDDSQWMTVEILNAPNAEYLLLDCPANKVIRTVEAKLVKQTDSYKIYDVGENLTGVPVILSSGIVGDKIVCTYSEEILENGELNPKNIFCQESIFFTDDRKEHKLRFTWHGFRYLKIASEKQDNGLDCKVCEVVHADIKNTSGFESDNETLANDK